MPPSLSPLPRSIASTPMSLTPSKKRISDKSDVSRDIRPFWNEQFMITSVALPSIFSFHSVKSVVLFDDENTQ
ncbi:hypothetical protein G9A89_001625 [Geosiphon pyriformis]|nr:hypothetical protein G9A89_001625 [Geosiphon pyriformis]